MKELLLYKIERRIIKEADEIHFKGQKYRLGGSSTEWVQSSSGEWISKSKREIVGPDGVVGTYSPDTGEVSVSGSGFPEEEEGPAAFKGPPRQSGWEITWEVPNPEGIAGAGRSGIFFPKEEKVDYTICPVCDGKKKEPGSRISLKQAKEQGIAANPKGKPCSNCYGFGILNPKVNAYVNLLKQQGKAPKVKIARGVSRFPIAGVEI